MEKNPTTVTIVTVSYNAAELVDETIRSVLAQSYAPLEYIIIDGGSTDGTVSRIQAYNDRLTCFITEPDQGIYDAMNKAVRLAGGAYINFMNAGDRFHADDVVARVMASGHEGYDFIYGDHIYENATNSFHVKTRPLELMWQRISFSHQSLFARRSLLLERPFDLRWRIVSDYAFYFSCYAEGCSFLCRDFPVAVFRAGGISDRCFLQRTYERWQVVRRYRNCLGTHAYYIGLLLEHYGTRLKKNFRRKG